MTFTYPKRQLIIAAALAAAMAITRYHHFGSAFSLPDASLAIFFLTGMLLRRRWFFVVLVVEAGIIDYLATQVGGVSDWCLSPAYWFLIPTYATVWFGGRWYAARHQQSWHTALPLMGSLLIVTTTAFVISNGSFYLFSGHFDGMDWADYAARVVKYYPPYTLSTFVYVALAAIGHVLISSLEGVMRPISQRRALRD